jgi:hypothetical protein
MMVVSRKRFIPPRRDNFISWIVGGTGVIGAIWAERRFHGWGEQVAVTALVFGGLVALAPDTWIRRPLFWLVLLVTLTVHACLMLFVHENVGNLHSLLILFAIAEVFLIIVVLGVVLDKLFPSPNNDR